MGAPAFNLDQVLRQESLTAHFQPIISVRRKSIVGYEGLMRGLHPSTGQIIPPMDLFNEAHQQGGVATLELDRLCRKTVLENFRGIKLGDPDGILSLNFEASVIDHGVVGSGNLIQQVNTAGVNPESIAIEIVESNISDLEALQAFIKTYRQYGFLIALDDVGAGHSNLNRIPLLKPDILKIDRYLIKNISKDFYKQEVFKSLVGLAHKIGALIVAEGIETEEEGLFVSEMGVDMMQGYYFYKPQPPETFKTGVVSPSVREFPDRLKEALLRKLNAKREHLMKYELLTQKLQAALSEVPAAGFDAKLLELIHHFPSVECLYVLDEKGLQVSDTVFANAGIKTKNRLMFRPAEKGSDHAMKDYYYMMMNSGNKNAAFITEPYISLATGNTCLTFTRLFTDKDNQKRVLCVDINTEFL